MLIALENIGPCERLLEEIDATTRSLQDRTDPRFDGKLAKAQHESFKYWAGATVGLFTQLHKSYEAYGIPRSMRNKRVVAWVEWRAQQGRPVR